ncbi:MAG: large repetitive protein, partial [Candidatus Hydrogenedentes bacterium]|nr:large repetitive protein [Candidatus Hydrogenedentota bacterium]
GNLTLAVRTASDVQDLGGIPLISSVTSAPVFIDHTPPLIGIGMPSVAETRSGPVDYLVSFVDASGVVLMPEDITLDVTGNVDAMFGVSPAKDGSYTVTLSNITGTGTLGFTIAPGAVTDAAGNPCAGASTPVMVRVDNSMPLAAWPMALALLAAGLVFARKPRTGRR